MDEFTTETILREMRGTLSELAGAMRGRREQMHFEAFIALMEIVQRLQRQAADAHRSAHTTAQTRRAIQGGLADFVAESRRKGWLD